MVMSQVDFDNWHSEKPSAIKALCNIAKFNNKLVKFAN